MAALLAAALAAASVGSAATAKTSKMTAFGQGKKVTPTKLHWGGSKGSDKQGANGMVGNTRFAPVPAGKISLPKNANGSVNYAALTAALKEAGKINAATNRALPNRRGFMGKASSALGSTAGLNIPHIHSLPITSANADAKAAGLNEYWQEATHGGVFNPFAGLTPPDQGLAEGNGKILEIVNNVFVVADVNFNHPLAAEPNEGLFASAILATGFSCLSDPRAIYDQSTNRWFITEAAYGGGSALGGLCGPAGSAVFIAVSNTADPQGAYTIYALNTSTDGTTCTLDGCLADQPLLGFDRYGLFISTNSFDWNTGAFNGTQMYIIDKTALAAQFLFPNLAYIDIGGSFLTPEGINSCGIVNPGVSNGYCWGSVNPAKTPNLQFVADRGGTEFALAHMDFNGSNDNRIADWSFTNTSSISGVGPIFVANAIVTTEAYGFPFTNNCAVMPQMAAFGVPTTQCSNAEQPPGPSGGMPLCATWLFPLTLGCEPGQIATNDDRIGEVTLLKTGNTPASVWGALNTDANVADPIGVLHRRAAIAYFDISATSWIGPFINTAGVNGQGYVGNWNNDVVFPAIGVGTDGSHVAMVYSLTGNTNFPSVAVSKFSSHTAPTSIGIVLQGQDVLDDFCTDFPLCGPGAFGNPYRPRYGDYSASVSDGNTIYLASEYVQAANCSDITYLIDPSCGGTRGAFSNWGTGLVRVHV